MEGEDAATQPDAEEDVLWQEHLDAERREVEEAAVVEAVESAEGEGRAKAVAVRQVKRNNFCSEQNMIWKQSCVKLCHALLTR